VMHKLNTTLRGQNVIRSKTTSKRNKKQKRGRPKKKKKNGDEKRNPPSSIKSSRGGKAQTPAKATDSSKRRGANTIIQIEETQPRGKEK